MYKIYKVSNQCLTRTAVFWFTRPFYLRPLSHHNDGKPHAPAHYRHKLNAPSAVHFSASFENVRVHLG